MKKILINAISIKEGGGAVVLQKLMRAFLALRSDIHWVLVIDEGMRNYFEPHPLLEVVTFPWVKRHAGYLVFWYEWVLPRWVKANQVDLVFSQTNLLPHRKLACPTLLLMHNAGYCSDEFEACQLKGANWKGHLGWWIRKRGAWHAMKNADGVTVQTEALADEIRLKVKPRGRLTTIPHGPGLAEGVVTPKAFPERSIWRFGYITKFGVQKNFEVLFEALQILKAQGHRVTLVLTLDPQAPAYQPIHQAMLGYGVEECIENHGESSVEILQKLYASLDAFVFPSLCESFGFTLVEALYYGLPVIAADVRSYHDIADQAAMYFPARDAHQLAHCMMSLQADSKRYEQMSLTALQRGQSYSWSKAAQELLGVMDQLIQGRA